MIYFRKLTIIIYAVLLGIAPSLPAGAFTGQKYSKEVSVSMDQAREIALKAVPGGKIVKEELEKEKGGSGLRYSFDIENHHVIHEVGVDAKSGKVLENSLESQESGEGESPEKAGNAVLLPANQRDMSHRNTLLLEATSPFEDMVDAALAGDAQAIDKALADYEGMAGRVIEALPDAARTGLENHLAQLREAATQNNYQVVAENAVEIYRTLTTALNPAQLHIPTAVAMLDYVGFKQRVLLHAKSVDWAALSETTKTARQNWKFLSSKINDAGLRDAVETMLNGMNTGISLKNPEMAEFAARMDLALVDLIENYFKQG